MISKRVGHTHMSISVPGALAHKGKLRGFTDDNGREMSDKEVRERLRIAQFEGKKKLPCSPCDNFDYQTGCRGHDITLLVHDYEFEEGNG